MGLGTWEKKKRKTGEPINQSTNQLICWRARFSEAWRNGKPCRLGKIGNDGFFKMDEKTTLKYASPCSPRTYGFCHCSELFPIGPNRSHLFPIVPNCSESFRFVPFRSENVPPRVSESKPTSPGDVGFADKRTYINATTTL